MEKTNDMLLNMMANQDFALRDFQSVGLTSENTALLSEDKYKSSDKITTNPLFLDENGNFDENKFHQFYVGASYMYNQLATQDYKKTLLGDARFSLDNMWVSPERRTQNHAPRLVKNPNTYLVTNSLDSLGKRGPRTKSISEIALSQLIYDTETGEWKDSPNDAFWANFANTLVLATYDEDETDEDGNIVHKKGDMKLNEDDLPYYETLGGRSVAGKQVLNKMNVLTTDGSTANKFDFFDSDGLEEKNWAGTLVKNAALVGSMFIPYVGPVVAGASVLSLTVGLLGTLGKLVPGQGDNKVFNNMEGWAKSVNRQAQSEYATQNTWCGENFINMIGDTIGLLAEQRWLFKAIPTVVYGSKGYKAMSDKGREALIKETTEELSRKGNGQKVKELIDDIRAGKFGTNVTEGDVSQYVGRLNFLNQEKAVKQVDDLIAKASKIGSPLSKAYMTAITVQDTYGEAKEAGASDLEAALLTLGYAAAEAKLLNSEVGSWIIPEARGEKFRAKAIANALTKDVKDAYGELATTKSKSGFAKRIMEIGRKIGETSYARYTDGIGSATLAVLGNALSEGFEEVSEEVLADASKSMLNVTRWLRGEEGLDMGQWDNIGDRYIMSALGGFVGGGITSAGTDFVVAKNLASMDKTQAMLELLYMVNNGKEKDFLKTIDSLSLGNKDLSANKILANGPEGYVYAQGTNQDNQDKEIKTLVHNQVDLLKNILNSEGASLSTESLILKLTGEDLKSVMKDLRFGNLRNAASLGLYLLDFQNIQSELVATKAQLLAMDRKLSDGQQENLDDIDLRSQLNTKLQGLRIKKDAYIKGHTMGDFVRDAVFEMNPILSDFAVKANVERFAKYKKGKEYSKLTEEEKKQIDEEFDLYSKTELKNDVHQQAAHFLDMMENATPVVQAYIPVIQQMKLQHDIVRQMTEGLAGTLSALANINVINLDPETIVALMQDAVLANQTQVENATVAPNLDFSEILELQDILNLPSTATTQEEIEKENAQKQKEYKDKLFELSLNHIDSIAQPFVKQGFMHPETKKLIEGMLTQMSNATMDGLYDPDPAISSAARNQFETIKLYKDKLKDLPNTPILKWISEYQSAATNSTINLDLHWKNTMDLFANASGSKGTLEDFGIDSDWETNNEEAQLLIDSFKAVVTGMRTDNADFNNPTSYSKIVNQAYRLSKVLNYVPLAEINSEEADLILEDVQMLEDRFNFAENLSALNKGQKLKLLDRVGANNNTLLYHQFKNFATTIIPDDWERKDILENALNSLQYEWSEEGEERNLKLSKDELRKQEEDILNIRTAIYDFFLANKDATTGRISKDKYKSLVSKLMNDSGYFEQTGDLLTDKTETLDKNSFFWWTIANGTLNAQDFTKAYRKGMTDDLAPIPSQELATQLGVAAIVNMDMFNDAVDAYREAANEMFLGKTVAERKALLQNSELSELFGDEYVSYFAGSDILPQYHNMIFVEGAPGTGKSGGVAKSIKATLAAIDPEYLKDAVYVHTTDKSALDAAAKLDMHGKTYGKEKWMKHISDNWLDNSANLVEVTVGLDKSGKPIKQKRSMLLDGTYKWVDGRLQSTLKINDDADAPKVVFIDEISHYDELELSTIELWARKHGTVVITMGDLDQDTKDSWAKDGNKEIQTSISRNKFIRSPKQGVSLRTHNAQLSKSIASAKLALENIRKKQNALLSFSYFEQKDGNNQGLYGVKTYDLAGDISDNDVAEIDKTIQLMLNSRKDTTLKIGYIYHDSESKLYKHITSKYSADIQPYKGSDAQGLEGQYYIVENDRNENNVDTMGYMRSLYTGISRAEQGILAITPSSFSTITSIVSQSDKSFQIENIGPEAIARSSKRKIDILDDIIDSKGWDVNDINITIKAPEKNNSAPTGPAATPPGPTPPTPPSGFPPTPPAPPAVTPGRVNYGFNDLVMALDELNNFLAKIQPLGELDTLEVVRNADGVKFTMSAPQLIDNEVNDETVWTPTLTLTSEDGSEIIPVSVMELNNGFTISSPAGESQAYTEGYQMTINESGTQKNVIISRFIPGTPLKYEVTDLDGSNPREYTQRDLQDMFIEEYIAPEPEPEESIIETGLENDTDEYDHAVEGSSFDPPTPEPTTPTKAGDFVHELYSALSFDMGVDKDESTGEIKFDGPQEKFDARIDGAIGLSKLLHTKDYDAIEAEMAFIRNLINSEENNSKLASTLRTRLGLTGSVNLRYALKTTAGRQDNPDYNRYDQGENEKSSYVKGDDKAGRLKFVMLLENDNKTVLEIPVARIDSPLTLVQMEHKDGTKLYPELFAIYDSFKGDPNLDSKAMEAIVAKADAEPDFYNNPLHTDIVNRIKTWRYTSNGIIYAPRDFNVAKDMHPTSPYLSTSKGKWDDLHPWIPEIVDIQELAKNKQLNISSIMASKDGRISGQAIKGLLPGRAFVLISSDARLKTDSEIADHFIAQVLNPNTVPPKVKIAYLRPPSESPAMWAKSLYQIITKTGGDKHLGNEFTGYRIIQALAHANQLEAIGSSDGDPEAIKSLKEAVAKMEEIEAKWKADDIQFKDLDEQDEYELHVAEYGEKAARRYMQTLKQKEVLRSELESTSPAITKGTSVERAFQRFLVHAFDPALAFGKTPTKPESETMRIIDDACRTAGFTNVHYVPQYSSAADANISDTFIKMIVNPANKYALTGMDGSAKGFGVAAKIDAPQYNTAALNPMFAEFAQHTYFDKKRNVWKMDRYLENKYEKRYLDTRSTPSGGASITPQEKLRNTYSQYFADGTFSEDVLNNSTAPSEATMLLELVREYNTRPGGWAFIYNSVPVVAKFPNPNWKITDMGGTSGANALVGTTDVKQAKVYDSVTGLNLDVEISFTVDGSGNINGINCRCTEYKHIPVTTGSSTAFNVSEPDFNNYVNNYNALKNSLTRTSEQRKFSSMMKWLGKLYSGQDTSTYTQNPSLSVHSNFIAAMTEKQNVDRDGVTDFLQDIIDNDFSGFDPVLVDAVKQDIKSLLNTVNGVGSFNFNIDDLVMAKGRIAKITNIVSSNYYVQYLDDNSQESIVKSDITEKLEQLCHPVSLILK